MYSRALDNLLIVHLDAGGDLIVSLGHDVDDVGAVSLQQTHVRPSDPLSQGLVGLPVLVNHSEHDEEVVLLGHAVNVTHAGVVKQLPVGIESSLTLGPVQMALMHKCGFQNALQIIF